MPTLDICEYRSLVRDDRNDVVLTGREPADVFQQVAVGGASAQSAPFADGARLVRLHADSPCRIKFGANPVASSGAMRMAAGATEYFGVMPGHRLAVIAST